MSGRLDIASLCGKYRNEDAHSRHVAALTLQLFDQARSQLGIPAADRRVLEAAALLHDIGWSQGDKAHHKNSMKLILKDDFDGWAQEEQRVVANVARYHRKSMPSESHKNYAALGVNERHIVRRLSALLRIADGLDRSHSSAVEKLQCDIKNDQILLDLTCRRDLHLEHYGFEKKRDLFHAVFGLEIVIHEIKNSGMLNIKFYKTIEN